MDKYKEIRPIVLGIVKKDNKLLVCEGYDKATKQNFYRSIGGGIEFLETSEEALKREFKEELDIDIIIDSYCGIIENIFKYQGRNGHELVLIYNVSIKDEDYKKNYHILDENKEFNALWIEIEKFKNNEKLLYPSQILKFI